MKDLKLDLGCGGKVRPGFVGVDSQSGPGVEYVVDFDKQNLPFEEGSVQHVFSSHCLEHLQNPTHLLAEISRVCADGAQLEFWLPYGWSNGGFIFDHKTMFNEEHFLQMTVLFPDFWDHILHARWQLNEMRYVVPESAIFDLTREGISMDFALKYFKGVAQEFGIFISVHKNRPPSSAHLPERKYAFPREGPWRPVEEERSSMRPFRLGGHLLSGFRKLTGHCAKRPSA